MVGLLMPDGVRRHVGNDEVRCLSQCLQQEVRRGIVGEVHLENGCALNGFHRQKVDADHRRLGHLIAHHLRPATGRNAQIDHGLRPTQEAEFFIQLNQFISRTAAVTLRLGAFDIGVVELPL